MELEKYFQEIRDNAVGYNQTFDSVYGNVRMVYADWTASGRLYGPIEDKMKNTFGPFVANTHSESSETGMAMTKAYHIARDIIKAHVNAGPNDVLITAGSGMTGVVNKLQRILGLRITEKLREYVTIPEEMRPVVFVTHMEHHSNQTSWLETIAEVVVLEPNAEGAVCVESLKEQLAKYKDKKYKIGSFSACSNVTGIQSSYHEMAKLMHQNGGICFVDFAASAPYVKIDMHPADPDMKLDAIFFSPHKFLGGPGTSGVLVFDSGLYSNEVPDNPGGGTVDWTNPWGEKKYSDDIETREDGGTPGFLQTIRTALSIELKEKMGIENMLKREEEILKILFEKLDQVKGLNILAGNIRHRLGIVSFYVDNIHFNLLIRILNDRFGIQARGGCSCAGTYGHYLLHITKEVSHNITCQIDHGNLSEKPGWIRISFHPLMTDKEIIYIGDSIKTAVDNIEEWRKDYTYDPKKNEFMHNNYKQLYDVHDWFKL